MHTAVHAAVYTAMHTALTPRDSMRDSSAAQCLLSNPLLSIRWREYIMLLFDHVVVKVVQGERFLVTLAAKVKFDFPRRNNA